MPVHNEQDNLVYSLPALFAVEPDEIIIILDRCSDRSREVIDAASVKLDYKGDIKLIEVAEDFPDWRYRVARLFRIGFAKARNDTILTMAADIVLDKKIKDYVPLIESSDVKLISFGLKYYPVDMIFFVKRIVTLVFPGRGFSGVFLFSKKAWRETEDPEKVKRIVKAQDTFLSDSIKKRYSTRHVWLDVVHLRARRDVKDQYLRGVTAYQVSGKSLPSVFISSIIYLRPLMLMGYMHARDRARKQ
ncbi:MAG: glycosyltransferase [Candidatus Bathyarchaeota archaeon]|nr:glycosyltransferase [Candidatus Bathyarchaeota archaeon]